MKPVPGCGLVLLGFAIFCGIIPLVAQTESMTESARNVWLEKNQHNPGEVDFQFDRITGQGDLFVFERFDPESFVILMNSVEGCILVGYSIDNLFFGGPYGTADQTKLLEAFETAGKKDPGNLKGGKSFANNIGPLIRSQWGQGDFFNFYCPRDSRGPNGRVYAGCIAVAMGQILRYYGGGNSINFQHDNGSGNSGVPNVQIGPYDWASMENSPITINLEISDLLRDLGDLVHMSYSASGSTTNSHRTLEAFHELGYVGGIQAWKSRFTPDSWIELFYQNLSEYKPILVTGGGHAFVCDGYTQDGLFHFNLGWDGYGDGYYPLSGVMTLPVNEAFIELEPISWPKPPKSIGLKSYNRQGFVTWNYEPDQNPVLTRVYVDDQLFLETTDTLLSINQLSPGIHAVHVSAVYPDGESRWIGPVDVFVRGANLAINDPQLYAAIQKSLNYGVSDTQEPQIYEGDLSLITTLNIDQPVSSLEGLQLCHNLKRLIIQGFQGPELDAGPLESLSQLRILEWNGRMMLHPEAIGNLRHLTELRIRQTTLAALDFLRSNNNLLRFEYAEAPVADCEVLTGLPLLDELVLKQTNLSDASFVSRMRQLVSIDLSGNNLTETGFLSTLFNLDRADLSNNHISKLLLTDQLQSLHKLDVSGNQITGISITAELNLLQDVDLSGNQLTTPGRLFLYTPVLAVLDLSNNRLGDMGRQRCPNLENLNVSGNQLITTDWISLQPRLKHLDAEHNRISDLSGLTKNNLFRQLNFLGLDRNPLSKQSFLEWLPVLVDAIDTVTAPLSYQPLSPCYPLPANGSQLVGPEIEFQWFADQAGQECVYDLFIVKGDSLVRFIQGLDSCKVKLSQRPASAFSWLVASRTADSVYYSGVYDVTSTAEWAVPFIEGFEAYGEGESLSLQSDYWLISGDAKESSQSARIVSSNSRSGLNSLELGNGETAILSTEHLSLPYISIRFSILLPPGQHGEFRVENMNGMYFQLVWDESDVGRLYVNDKFYCSFTVDHLNWMDYQVMAHARNNNFHIQAGQQLIVNEPWKVPEGVICAERILFSSYSDEDDTEANVNKLFIDDVEITSAPGTSSVESDCRTKDLISIYPNPFADQVTISFPEPGRYHVSIIDMAGREVYQQMIDASMNQKNTIRLTDLPPGVYMLRPGSLNFKPLRLVRNRTV